MAISTHYFPETKITPAPLENPWIKQGKVLTELALPFISLYKPAGTTLSYGMGLYTVTQSMSNLVWGKPEKRMQNALSVAKGVADLSTAFFQYRALIIANSMIELTQGVYNLYQAPREEKPAHLGKCLVMAVQLLAVVQQNSLQWMILSSLFQALSHFYQAYQTISKPDAAETPLIIIAKTAMGFIRLYQAQQIFKHLQLMKEIEQWEAENNNAALISGEPVQEAPKRAISPNLLSSEAPESLPPSENIPPALEADPLPSCPAVEDNHPLKNLSAQIEAKRVVLVDPTTQKKYDFGAYFHGYGKSLVNGANLRFQRTVSKDGSVVTELSFKVNRFYMSRSKERFENLKITTDQIKTLRASLQVADSEKPSDKTVLKDLIALKTYASGSFSTPSPSQTLSGRNGVTVIALKEDELMVNLKTLSLGDAYETRGIRINEVGSVEIGDNTVKVSLSGDRDIRKFHNFLSLFGLEEAVQPSTPEDLEKIKLGFLFRFFFPQEAYQLQKETSYSVLSLNEIKQRMIAAVPQMANYLTSYQIQPVEILPGFVRYSLPINKKIYELGARALTAMITGGKEGEITAPLGKKELIGIANIVKHGMFSENLRKTSGMGREGLGGNSNVFTQMVWKKDVDGRKKLEKFGYSSCGNIRLYFSLQALNRGSFQYDSDFGGGKQSPLYKKRKNILDFIKLFPFWSKLAKTYHELMVPDRILPEELQGMSVNTEQVRDQILKHFRKHQMIQRDAQGRETINGIAAEEFISVEYRVPAEIIKKCATPEAAAAG